MRKLLWSIMVCFLFSAVIVPLAYGEKNAERQKQGQTQDQNQNHGQSGQTGQNGAQNGQTGQGQQPQVQLSEAQKNELAKLHKDILEKKKEMVQKYVEFGVIPEDKGQLMISYFEKHYEMLEQNGFILKPHLPHHQKGQKDAIPAPPSPPAAPNKPQP